MIRLQFTGMDQMFYGEGRALVLYENVGQLKFVQGRQSRKPRKSLYSVYSATVREKCTLAPGHIYVHGTRAKRMDRSGISRDPPETLTACRRTAREIRKTQEIRYSCFVVSSLGGFFFSLIQALFFWENSLSKFNSIYFHVVKNILIWFFLGKVVIWVQ